MGIPFGFFLGIYFGFKYDWIYGCIGGLASGLLFGFFMAVILGGLHIKSTQGLPQSSDKEVGPHQSTTISAGLSFEEAYDKCHESLKKMNAGLTVQNKEEGEIEGVTKATWKSFGEIIRFKIKSIENQQVEIFVSSSPRVEATLLDYGKGLQNILFIEKFLSK